MINWSFLNLKLLVRTVVNFRLCDNFGILGFPVEADILAQIENLKSGKDAEKVTTSQDGFTKPLERSHKNTLCGVPYDTNKSLPLIRANFFNYLLSLWSHTISKILWP